MRTEAWQSTRKVMAAQMIFEAALSEFTAAAVHEIPSQMAAARPKVHDALDALLDARAEQIREALNRGGA